MSLYYKIVVFAGAAIGLGRGVAEGYDAIGIIGSMLAWGLIGAFFGFLYETPKEDPDQEDKLEKWIREKHATFLCSHNSFDFNYIYPNDCLK